MNYLIYFLFLVFLINGLFWSLASHTQHCYIFDYFKIKCPTSHTQLVIFGIINLTIAIMLKQHPKWPPSNYKMKGLIE